MARLNKKDPLYTHEGAVAVKINAEKELRRSVLSCLLWENTFYESGESIADRITNLCSRVSPEIIANLAIEARHQHHLRHVPLLLLRSLVRYGNGKIVQDTIAQVISRPDELGEFVSIYWQDKNNKKIIPAQMKKGLARALSKFNEYSLQKYNGKDAAVKIKDVLFLSHAKPKDEEQDQLWKKLIAGTLQTPDTWETELSAGKDKKETFERLIREEKLGYFALLRNLRNMINADCDLKLVKNEILAKKRGADKILPFRYIAAARAAPQLEKELDHALCDTINSLPVLDGTTVVLVDVSDSMNDKLSGKSDLSRADAAAALASIINSEHLRVFSFSSNVVEVPARKGMAGVDAILKSQYHSSTRLGEAIDHVSKIDYDRLIVITDEQSHDRVKLQHKDRKNYMINVASYQNGVGYNDGWHHIDGFSENVIRWIIENEKEA